MVVRKNRKLFSNLKALEETFFNQVSGLMRPRDTPWRMLSKVLTHLEQYVGDARIPWPENAHSACLPGSDEHTLANRGVDNAKGSIESFGSLHVRGGKGLKTDEDTQILGPVILGSGVKIRKGAVITGPCLIGDGVTIGVGCRIKHSILMPGSEVRFGTRLSYSIIGRRVRIGDSLISEEESWDKAWHPWSDQLPRVGFFAGDDSWIGAGCVISSGVVLRRGTRVKEGSRLAEEEYKGLVGGRRT